MTLRKAEKNDYKTIKKLYLSAFPPDERAPFYFLKLRAKQGHAEMLIAENGGEFLGFTYSVTYKDLVYLFYFAVSEDKRGQGNGTEILEQLKKSYKGKKIFIAREQLDEKSDNYEQRVQRHKFYLKCGFADLPYCIKEATILYDVMSFGGDIDPEDYNTLIRKWAGRIRSILIPMKAIRKEKTDA